MTDQLPIAARARLAVELLETDTTLSVASVAEEVGVSPSTALKYWRKSHSTSPRGWRQERFATLCAVMLDHINQHEQTAAEIFSATTADYGEAPGRRLWRALRRLMDTGKVLRHGELCSGRTYTRSTAMIERVSADDLHYASVVDAHDEVSLHNHRAMAAELIKRRATDLSAEETAEAERFLAWAVDDLEVADDPSWAPLFAGARAVRKLLADHGVKP